MNNHSNVSPAWAGFRKLWIIIALILFLILLLMMLAGFSPWGTKCDVTPVDDPALIEKISTLEKEKATLKSDLAEFTQTRGLVAGLQAKISALESVSLDFDPPELTNRIKLLEAENASISDLKKRIKELEATNAKSNDERNNTLTKRIAALETENGLIAGLKAKVGALEALDLNFIQPEDNTELIQKINNLEIQTLAIPTLKSRITELTAENGMIAGLKAKVAALEAVDVNFIQPKDDSALLKRIDDLETTNGVIPGLKAKISALEAIDINFMQPKDDSALLKRIDDLEASNGIIPGLKAKIKALEAIDINFMKAEVSPEMPIPQTAKLYFESGSSRFPTDAGQSLTAVITYLRSNASKRVSLSGFHDESGNANWNRRLANKRANRVKQILIDAGVAESRIEMQTPTQTLGTGTPEEARRVEVIVIN